MAGNLYERGLTFLLAQPIWTDVEKQALEWLLAHARESEAVFWDVTRGRMPGSDLDVLIAGIIAKGRLHNLQEAMSAAVA
jgi:hypothetical protein